MQRGLSSFDIYVIVSELQELIGGYIDKIYQPSRDELLIKINNSTTNKKQTLYIKNGELICLTQKDFTMPQTPSTFAMTCRKYLQNGRITAIQQHEFDRIILLKIGKKEGDYTLIFELFQKGNIILENPEKIILLPLIKQQWSHRVIRSRNPYVPPPSQLNPFTLPYSQFQTIIKNSNSDLVRTLAVQCNLSGAYAEELCYRAQIEKNIKTKKLEEENIKKIFNELQKFLELFKQKTFTYHYVKQKTEIIDFIPVLFEKYQHYEIEKTPSFVQGLELFINKEIPKKQTKHQEKIKQLQRQLEQQHQTVTQFQQQINQKKIEGDIIYLNYHICQQLLQEITELLQQKEKTQAIQDINKKSIVKNFDPQSNELLIILQDQQQNQIQLALDFRKTVSENAEHAYQTSKKFQEKLQGAQKAIQQTTTKIQSLQQQETVEKEQKTQKTGKQFWFERFRWFITKEGNIVIAGRDAKTNDIIVKKYLKETDRYVHADVHGAPSCIVKSLDIHDNTIPISEKTLEEACIFAASYSKAWNQFADAQAYWVYPEQVSKTPQSGEYVPKGAFIIRGKRNHYRCKLELGIGEITIDNNTKLMAAPVTSLTAYSQKYILLQSGPTQKNTISKTLAQSFTVSQQIIDRLLPPGGVTVIKTIGFELKR